MAPRTRLPKMLKLFQLVEGKKNLSQPSAVALCLEMNDPGILGGHCSSVTGSAGILRTEAERNTMSLEQSEK